MTEPVLAGVAVAPSLQGWIWSSIIGDEDGDRFTGDLGAGTLAEATKAAVDEALKFAHFDRALINRHDWSGMWVNPKAPPDKPYAAELEALAKEARDVLRLRPLMRRGVRERIYVPGLIDSDPFLAAADASLSSAGRPGWGCVTGSGWVMHGDLPRNSMPNIQQVELWAAARAAAMFPEGCAITVITDNRQVAEAGKRLLDGEPYEWVARTLRWMAPPRNGGVASPLDLFREAAEKAASVNVIWRRRESHPLQSLADRYSRPSSRPAKSKAPAA
jgi:hypothetical protein